MLNKLKLLVAQKFFTNAVWLYLFQMVNTLLPFVTLPYITRILGADGYGVLSIAINIVGYLQVVVEYGFGMSATRTVAAASDKKKEIRKLAMPIFASRVILMGCSMAIMFFYMVVAKLNVQELLCMLIMFVGLLGVCVQMNWAFQGTQNMKYISITNILSRLLSTIFTFIFVKRPSDIYAYCILYVLSQLVSGVLGLFFAKRLYGIKFSKTSWQEIKEELKKGWLVFTTSLSAKIFGAIGVTILPFFVDNADVGVFSALQKIPNLMLVMWAPISQILYPMSSIYWKNSFDEGKNFVSKSRKFILPMFVFASCLIAIWNTEIVNFVYGKEYVNYSHWMYPLLAWVVISIVNNFTGVQTLLASGRDLEYSRAFNISVICTVVINVLFVYLWGGFGAAFAPLVSEMLLGILLIIEINKIHRK